MTGTSKNKRRISLPCLSAVYAVATPSPPYPKYRPAQQPLFSCASEAVHIRTASCQAAAVPFGLLRFLREQYPSWQECKIVPVALQYSFFLLLFWSFFPAVFIFGSSCSVCIFCAQARSDNSRTSAINSANIRLGVIFIAIPFRISHFGRNRRHRIRCDCFRCWKSCARSSGWRSSYG